MINIIPADTRAFRDFGWLKTRWHFSFGDYIDRSNVNFGALRVFNDDIIAPGGTFEPHPHRDMEIISVVTRGQLAHEDSTGAKGVVKPWEIQTMSAGAGIVHSERNPSASEETHLLQIWILPRTRGSKPHWQQKAFDPAKALNTLLPIVSSGSIPETLPIDQDAALFLSTLQAGHTVLHTAAPGRKLYVFLVSGAVTANGQTLAPGDQARIESESQLELKASEDASLILIDLP